MKLPLFMKYIPMRFALLIAVLLSSLSLTNSNSFEPAAGLIAYYDFNDCTATDLTGNGSDGRLIGNVGCYCGVEEDGLVLDGQNAYIEFPGPVNRYFATSNLTVSFYFRPLGYAAFPQSLLSKRNSCGDDHFLDIQYHHLRQEIGIDFQETVYKYYPDLSTKERFHYLGACSYCTGSNRAYTYINGTLRQESFRCSGVDISNPATLAFSHSPCTQGGRQLPFHGILDQLRVYQYALSSEEIQALYNLYPVEQAETDCLAALNKKTAPSLQDRMESPYLCAKSGR
jgi:hypothetical protein